MRMRTKCVYEQTKKHAVCAAAAAAVVVEVTDFADNFEVFNVLNLSARFVAFSFFPLPVGRSVDRSAAAATSYISRRRKEKHIVCRLVAV